MNAINVRVPFRKTGLPRPSEMNIYSSFFAQHCYKLMPSQELGSEWMVYFAGWQTWRNRMKTVLVATGLALTLFVGGVANAANTPSTEVTPAASATPAYAKPAIADADAAKAADQLKHTNIRQELQDQLAKAGYTSVNITPSSFFVEAKDKQGNPVQILIGPELVYGNYRLGSQDGNGSANPSGQLNSEIRPPLGRSDALHRALRRSRKPPAPSAFG